MGNVLMLSLSIKSDSPKSMEEIHIQKRFWMF
jgi:hypothetical protein